MPSGMVFCCREEDGYVNANEKRRRYTKTCYEDRQKERNKRSSCYKCPYRGYEAALKCFPCMRKILGEQIPELEEKEDEQ
jgi:hypothetical protein